MDVAGPPSSDRQPGRPRGKFTQHKRMSDLRALLHRHPKGVTLNEIAAHLDVTPRSARRYLGEINTKLDLEAVPERPSGQKRWRIPSVDLPRRVAVRRTQAYALLAARALFDPMRGSTLYEEIDLAAQALLGVARRPGRGPNAGIAGDRLEQRFVYLPFAPKDYSPQAEELDNLFQAVADLWPLRCRYPRKEDGVIEAIVIHPYALLLYKDAIWCIGLHCGRSEVMAFMLDAIRATECLDVEHFELPNDFSVDDYAQGQFGIWRQTEPCHDVVIDFDATVADHLMSRCLHHSQRNETLDGGRVRVHLELGDLTEVALWVLGFGSRAEVVAPPALRDAVRQELETTLERYG